MKLEYDGETYTVEQISGDLYRAYTPTKGVSFGVEYRGGTYFKFWSAYIGERAYSAWSYATRWIPIMREASNLIAKTDGIYDYQHNVFKKLAYNEVEDKMMWVTI